MFLSLIMSHTKVISKLLLISVIVSTLAKPSPPINTTSTIEKQIDISLLNHEKSFVEKIAVHKNHREFKNFSSSIEMKTFRVILNPSSKKTINDYHIENTEVNSSAMRNSYMKSIAKLMENKTRSEKKEIIKGEKSSKENKKSEKRKMKEEDEMNEVVVLKEKLSSMNCSIQNLSSDTTVWASNKTHQINLPFKVGFLWKYSNFL